MNGALYIVLSFWVGGFAGFLICSLLTVGREESEWWDAEYERMNAPFAEREDRKIK